MMSILCMSSSKILWKNSIRVNKQSRTCAKSKAQTFIFIYSIDYLQKTYNVLASEPTRSDSMMFSRPTGGQKDNHSGVSSLL